MGKFSDLILFNVNLVVVGVVGAVWAHFTSEPPLSLESNLILASLWTVIRAIRDEHGRRQ